MTSERQALSPPSLTFLRWFPVLLAGAIAALAAADPLLALAATAGVVFFIIFFWRREWLVAGLLVFFLFQNLLVNRIQPMSESLASIVKRADDLLILFFFCALAAEAVLPRVRLREIPQWRLFLLAIGLSLFSAVLHRLSARETAVGVYVMFKDFVWFFLAASLRLDERGRQRAFRFLIGALGAVLAFAFVQFLTGDLTYNLLGLPKDYRFGLVRLRSIFIHPVFLAQTMSLLTVVCVCMYLYSSRAIYLFLALGALAAVGLTMLVKTMLALGLVVGFVLLRKRLVLLIPYAFAGAMAMISFAEYGAENVRHQFAMYIESPRSVRREGYRICGEILRASPLLGCGPGRFGGYAATLLDSPVPLQHGFINYDYGEYSSIDCHWPHLAAEMGLIGLAAYLWLLGAMGRGSWRLSQRTDLPPHARSLAMAAAVYLVVAIIEAFAVSNFEDTFCGFMIFSMLGLTQRVDGVDRVDRVDRVDGVDKVDGGDGVRG